MICLVVHFDHLKIGTPPTVDQNVVEHLGAAVIQCAEATVRWQGVRIPFPVSSSAPTMILSGLDARGRCFDRAQGGKRSAGSSYWRKPEEGTMKQEKTCILIADAGRARVLERLGHEQKMAHIAGLELDALRRVLVREVALDLTHADDADIPGHLEK